MAKAEDSREPSDHVPMPFTFRGVALLARGPGWRLAVALVVAAVFVALCCVWFLSRHWAPAVDEAIASLPASKGAIRDGRLHWEDTEWRQLTRPGGSAKPHFIVDPENRKEDGSGPDVQLELRKDHWVLSSVMGYWRLKYPDWLKVDLHQQRLSPWWGARRPFLLLGAGVTVVLWLAFAWLLAALAGAWPVRTVAYFADREGSLGTYWRLALAAMIPAAVLFALGVVCYGLGLLPLLGLVVVFALHLVVAWVFMFFAPFYLSRIEGAPRKGNPFKDKGEGEAEGETGNPFGEGAKAKAVRTPVDGDG